MRFQVRDLLLATTIAAVYAAGFAWLPRLGEERLGSEDFLFLPIFFAYYGVVMLFSAWRSLKQLGDRIVAWGSPTWWQPHLVILFLFFVYLAISGLLGEPLWIAYPAIMVGQHLVHLFNGWIVLGEKGVHLGTTFVPWDACRLRLDEEAKQLFYSHDYQMLSFRFPYENQRLVVPAEKLDAVRAVLLEKKPEAIAG